VGAGGRPSGNFHNRVFLANSVPGYSRGTPATPSGARACALPEPSNFERLVNECDRRFASASNAAAAFAAPGGLRTRLRADGVADGIRSRAAAPARERAAAAIAVDSSVPEAAGAISSRWAIAAERRRSGQR
jgi:hypothetical protein